MFSNVIPNVTESKPVKLETSHTVILSPTVADLGISVRLYRNMTLGMAKSS